MKVQIVQYHKAVVREVTLYELDDALETEMTQAIDLEAFVMERAGEIGHSSEIEGLDETVSVEVIIQPRTVTYDNEVELH